MYRYNIGLFNYFYIVVIKCYLVCRNRSVFTDNLGNTSIIPMTIEFKNSCTYTITYFILIFKFYFIFFTVIFSIGMIMYRYNIGLFNYFYIVIIKCYLVCRNRSVFTDNLGNTSIIPMTMKFENSCTYTITYFILIFKFYFIVFTVFFSIGMIMYRYNIGLLNYFYIVVIKCYLVCRNRSVFTDNLGNTSIIPMTMKFNNSCTYTITYFILIFKFYFIV